MLAQSLCIMECAAAFYLEANKRNKCSTKPPRQLVTNFLRNFAYINFKHRKQKGQILVCRFDDIVLLRLSLFLVLLVSFLESKILHWIGNTRQLSMHCLITYISIYAARISHQITLKRFFLYTRSHIFLFMKKLHA